MTFGALIAIWIALAVALLGLVSILLRRMLAGRRKRRSDRHARENAVLGGRPVSPDQPLVRRRQLGEGLVIAEPDPLVPRLGSDYLPGLEQQLEKAFEDYRDGALTLDGFWAVIGAHVDDLEQWQEAVAAQPRGVREAQQAIIAEASQVLQACAEWLREHEGALPNK